MLRQQDGVWRDDAMMGSEMKDSRSLTGFELGVMRGLGDVNEQYLYDDFLTSLARIFIHNRTALADQTEKTLKASSSLRTVPVCAARGKETDSFQRTPKPNPNSPSIHGKLTKSTRSLSTRQTFNFLPTNPQWQTKSQKITTSSDPRWLLSRPTGVHANMSRHRPTFRPRVAAASMP